MEYPQGHMIMMVMLVIMILFHERLLKKRSMIISWMNLSGVSYGIVVWSVSLMRLLWESRLCESHWGVFHG